MVLLDLLALGAAAAATPNLVRIDHAAAVVVVIPEARADAVATVQQRPGLPPVRVRRTAGGLVIDGGLTPSAWDGMLGHPWGASCKVSNGQPEVGAAWKTWRKDQLPVITLRVPLNAKVSGTGALYGTVGQAASVDLNLTGCGHWEVAPQRGPLTIRETGPGSVIARSADGNAYVAVTGAGDVTIAKGYTANLTARLKGSGNIRHQGSVAHLNADLHGSGLIAVREVTGRTETTEDGSGEIRYGHPKGVSYCNLC